MSRAIQLHVNGQVHCLNEESIRQSEPPSPDKARRSTQGMVGTLMHRPDKRCKGVGEAAMGPTSAAIANAIFDAVGIRLRQVPFTPQRVKEAIEHLQA